MQLTLYAAGSGSKKYLTASTSLTVNLDAYSLVKLYELIYFSESLN